MVELLIRTLSRDKTFPVMYSTHFIRRSMIFVTYYSSHAQNHMRNTGRQKIEYTEKQKPTIWFQPFPLLKRAIFISRTVEFLR